MTFEDLRVPESSCKYEIYNPTNLKPSNHSTCTRLTELNWSTELFKNKSVLDIGCNSGILSLYANKLGATSIKSVDVQESFVDFFTAVVSEHNLPIQVEKIGFNELKAETHAADVVLFMEVLHWIVDQKGSVEDAIYKLATLTEETLYLETPWDTKEPSIAKKGIINSEQYNIELIIKELQKYFDTVQVVRFMSYFGEMENSKRILIKASDKRENFESMKTLNGVNPLNLSLNAGTNQIQLMTGVKGAVILKTLPKESMLPLLDTKSANALFDTLASSGGHVLPPLKMGDEYIFENDKKQHVMLFPFVGNLEHYFQDQMRHSPVSNPLRLAVECRRTFQQIPYDVVQEIKEKTVPIGLSIDNELGNLFTNLISDHGLTEFIDDVYENNKILDRGVEDSVIHNDLQLGNMITDMHGKDWILDLDILRSGTAYSDFICCAIFNNSPKEMVLELYHEMVEINGRHIQLTDMYFAMTVVLKWISTINTYHNAALEKMCEPTVSGIKTLHSIVMAEQRNEQIAC